MAEFGGVQFTQNAVIQAQKAEELEQIILKVVQKIEEIDEEIQKLARGGIEGAAVEQMAKTYIKNREVISNYVKTFAAVATVLYQDAEGMKADESRAIEAAGGSL